MKRNYALVIMLFVIASSHAQNWNFIKANERYHFQHINESIPLNTILVDSVRLEESDSILSLNRLFLPCDTCEIINNVILYVDNQPGFLQRELIYSTDAGTVVLNDPEENIIKLPNSGIKEWWFNNEKEQWATIDTIEFVNVLGVYDSIATISINGQPQIKIAKELGLIQYFEYSLVGLEKAQLGTTLPSWKDFYDFEVGDEFMYYEDFNSFGAVPPQKYTFSKFKVSSINENADSIVIGWNEQRVITHFPHSETDPNTGQPDFSTTNIEEGDYSEHSGYWLITKDNYSGAYHNELKKYKSSIDGILMLAQFSKSNDVFELNYSQTYKEIEDESGLYSSENLEQRINLSYLPGRGLIQSAYYSQIILETAYYNQIGYVNGVDTTGFVFNDEFFEAKQSGNDFLSYTVYGSQGEIDTMNHEIYVVINLEKMLFIPAFKLSNKATAFIGDIEQESGVTEAFFNGNSIEYTVVAENGDSQEWLVNYDIIGNVSDVSNMLKGYPNPTSSIINIEGVEGAKLEVYNALGEKVREIDVSNAIESIVMNDLDYGIYFVKILKGNKANVVRFIYTE